MRRLSLVLALGALLSFGACSSDGPVFVVNQDAFSDAGGGGDASGADGVDPDGGLPDGGTPDGGPDATPTEVCDDGVDNDGDGLADCDDDDCAEQLACGGSCGDGTLDDGEECDDGGANNDTVADACRTNCTAASCGDRVVDTGEACDEGDNNGFGRCNLACQVQPVCGDRVVDAPETCDDGNDNPDDGCDNCQLTTAPACGDGFFTPGSEECDNGEGCGDSGVCEDDCTCTFFECGNGVLEGGEECDGAAGSCAPDGFCGPACACIDFVCGNDRLEPNEECDGTDDAVCGNDEFCNAGCACEAFVCGNGTTEGTEECDGTGCGENELCTDACVCEAAQVCGNDVQEGTEECDGPDGACPAGSACNDACLCENFVCGNDVIEGDEQCDGSADPCGSNQECTSTCECVGPPVLDAFPSDPLAGPSPALVLHPNLTDDFCEEDEEPHGYEITVLGQTSAPLSGATVRTPSGGLIGIATEALTGEFETTLELCLPELAEGDTLEIAMTNSFGESEPVLLAIPTLRAATLDTPEVFVTRDLNRHVFRLQGLAPDRNLNLANLDIYIGGALNQTIQADGWPLRTTFSGGGYSGVTALSGVLDVGIEQYDVSVITHGGLASDSSIVAAPSGLASSTGDCIPAAVVFASTCPLGRWCRETTSPVQGACSAATGAAPVLTSVSAPAVELGSANCTAEFPDYMDWSMVGNITTVPLLELRLALSTSAPDGIIIGQAPAVGAIDERRGICFTGDLSGETVTITLIDEAGRESASRSFVFP